MIKLLLHESKWRVGSPGVFITPGTYFIYILSIIGFESDYEKFVLSLLFFCDDPSLRLEHSHSVLHWCAQLQSFTQH